MSEFTTGLLVVFSEIGLVLLLVVAVVTFIMIRRKHQNRQMALQLVEKLKQSEEERKNNLMEMLKESLDLEEDAAANKAEQLIKGENTLYTRVLKLFLGREPKQIMEFDKNVEELISGYRYLIAGEATTEGDDEPSESTMVKLRKENTALREEKAQLKANLDVAMHTMENMMGEYASMYEGGKKEGEQRVKNEMFKLQQALNKGGPETGNKDSGSADELDLSTDEVPELNDVVEPADAEADKASLDAVSKKT